MVDPNASKSLSEQVVDQIRLAASLQQKKNFRAARAGLSDAELEVEFNLLMDVATENHQLR